MASSIFEFVKAQRDTNTRGNCIGVRLGNCRVIWPSCRDNAFSLTEVLLPATTDQVRELVTVVIGAFSSYVLDLAVHSQAMYADVAAARPSVISLASACWKLRHTRQKRAEIADVLQAIRDEEARWQYRLRCVVEVGHEHAQALAKLRERRAWLARPDEERNAERQKRLDTLRHLKQKIRAAAAARSLV